ncbi:Sec-independent protein translocase protein TatB [Bermanella sp. WJH001]|uniref:Sec-independent protein translocase protein TatB n=1 Tax=Bermanella sp. WJH001 TaxID=3048005 RepID=UPI0024BE589F|nr:Sec-independent protein translocase protein TatB [Bermanella sp. WJH001]MDJ1539098.1 Sec-independent protein translocase protein TatB [Bermanella sp. WJH001]
MFDIGFAELLVVGVLGLIVLGPERLPKAARTLGLLLGRVRRTMSGIQQEIEREVRAQELQEKLKDSQHSFMSPEEQALQLAKEQQAQQAQEHEDFPQTQPIENSIAPNTDSAQTTHISNDKKGDV